MLSRIGICELREAEIGVSKLAALDDMGYAALRSYHKYFPAAAGTAGGVWIGGKFYPSKRKKQEPMQESGRFDPRSGAVMSKNLIDGLRSAKRKIVGGARSLADAVRDAKPGWLVQKAIDAKNRLHASATAKRKAIFDVSEKNKAIAGMQDKFIHGVKHVGGYAGLAGMGGLAAAGSAASQDPYAESERSIVKRAIIKESLS